MHVLIERRVDFRTRAEYEAALTRNRRAEEGLMAIEELCGSTEQSRRLLEEVAGINEGYARRLYGDAVERL